MPKYWVKNYFTHGRFPEVGQKQKTEKKERPKVGENNGQATHGARKHAWRMQAAWAKILGDKLFRTWEIPRSGSKAKDGEKNRKQKERRRKRPKVGDNNGQAMHGACKPPGPKTSLSRFVPHPLYL